VDEAGFEDSAELHRALAAEALSYDTFLMPAADDPRAPGTTASAGSINAWLVEHAQELEGRRPWSRVGLVYSPDSWLRSFRPGGVPSVSIPDGAGTRLTTNFSHLHAFAGWHFALRRHRHQAQPLLAGRLQPGELDAFEVVVLPDLQVLPQALRDDVIEPWVRSGGTLVISGRTGRYRGRSEMYEPWSTGGAPTGTVPLTSIADLDQVSAITEVALGAGLVVVIPDAPGADAWLGRGFAAIDAAIAYLGSAGALVSAVASPPQDANVDVRLHVDMARGRLFIDLVNRNWSQGSDSLTAVGPQSLTVALPAWLSGQSLTARTAAARGTAVLAVLDGAVEVDVSAVEDVVTVVVESAVP